MGIINQKTCFQHVYQFEHVCNTMIWDTLLICIWIWTSKQFLIWSCIPANTEQSILILRRIKPKIHKSFRFFLGELVFNCNANGLFGNFSGQILWHLKILKPLHRACDKNLSSPGSALPALYVNLKCQTWSWSKCYTAQRYILFITSTGGPLLVRFLLVRISN